MDGGYVGGKDSSKKVTMELPIMNDEGSCNSCIDDIDRLMKETSQLRKIITKRGTFEILIPLCCSTNPVRHLTFKNSMKGFSSKTLAIRLKELERSGILESQAYKEIPPRVEYRLTTKGQELTESIVHLLEWMRKW